MKKAVELNPKRRWIIYIISLPLIIFAVFYVYTKEARQDLTKMRYPRKMYPVGLDTTKLSYTTTIDTVYHKINNFELRNQYNQIITKESFHDKIIIVNFFPPDCTDECSTMMEQLARLQSKMIRDDRVIILSFTSNPEQDAYVKLKKYAEIYDAVPGKWHFLTGERSDIQTLFKHSFKLSEKSDEKESLFSKNFVLIDPVWNIRGYYNGISEKNVNIMMGDILLLQEEFKR